MRRVALAALLLLPGCARIEAYRAERERSRLKKALPVHEAAWKADEAAAARAREAVERGSGADRPAREAAAKRWEEIAVSSRKRLEGTAQALDDAEVRVRETHLAAGTVPSEVARAQSEIDRLTAKLEAADATLDAARSEYSECKRTFERSVKLGSYRHERGKRQQALHVARDRVEKLARERAKIAALLQEVEESQAPPPPAPVSLKETPKVEPAQPEGKLRPEEVEMILRLINVPTQESEKNRP